MDVRAKLAKNLISLRQAKGWSQEDLADEAGLHRTYVSGIERKVRNPTITVLERLAKALKLAPGRLLDELDPYAKTSPPLTSGAD